MNQTEEQLEEAKAPASVASSIPLPSATRQRGLASRAVRGGAILMVARSAVQLLVWGVTLYVARLLTPFDYGLMTTGMIFLGLADLLAEAGFGRALIQKDDLHPGDVDTAFTLSLSLAVGLYALLFLIAPFAADFLELPPLTTFLRVLGLLVLAIPFRTVSLALLDRDLKMGRQAFAHVVMSCAQSATVLTLALLGANYWSLVAGAILGRALEAILLLRAADYSPRLLWPFGKEHRAQRLAMVRFGLHVSLGSLLWYVYSSSDLAIISKVAGAEALGYYALAFQLISMPVQKLTVNTNQVAYPVFCRLQDDRPRLRNWYLRLTVMLGFLGAPALAGMALVAPDAFALVLGERWTPAVRPFQLLSVVGIVLVYGASVSPLLNALGRPDINLIYTAICTVLLPTGFVIGGWHYGVEGICLAWLILYPLAVAGLIVSTRRLTGVGLWDLLWAQRAVFAGVVFMVGIVILVRHALADASWVWLRLTLAIVAGAGSYAGFLLVFARHTVLADLRRLYRQLRGGVE